MDVIELRGIECFGRHGEHESERAEGQTFEIDLAMHADLSKARASDQLADTIDYARAHAIVEEVIQGPSRRLLERLAGEIAGRIRDELGPERVVVTVRKPKPPFGEARTGKAQVTVTLDR